jgi:NADH:ubiquinone oxidoreductase subunit 6 (subunit J)
MAIVDVFVLLCLLLGLLSAVVVALHPNILYAAVALIGALLSVAGLYGALGADFLAAVQLIIYVGGIIVVILFAVMMSENIYRVRFLDGAQKLLAPAIASAIVLFGLLKLVLSTPWPTTVASPVHLGSAEWIGRALVGEYALVFQYVAIVLLAGLIGAVVVARPVYRKEEP